MISKYKVLHSQSQRTGNAFHIAFCVNLKYLPHVGVTITSIIKFNKDVNIIYNIFSDEYHEDFIDKITQLSNNDNITINLYKINAVLVCNKLQGVDLGSLGQSTMYRLFAFEYMSNNGFNKILYLDADVICKNSISELIRVDVSGVYTAAVLDWECTRKWVCKKLGSYELYNTYFNAGIMLVNCTKWKQDNLFESIVNLLQNKVSLILLDQDLLNMVMREHIMHIDAKFNKLHETRKIFRYNSSTKTTLVEPILESDVFIHYLGTIKPWHTYSDIDKDVIYYRSIHENSLWKDCTHDTPNSLLRENYRMLRDGKLYKKALKAWWQYLIYRYNKIPTKSILKL